MQCDAVVPRAQGISLSPHTPGRGGASTAAARVEFVKANYTAALASENGAVASLVPGVTHVARAWVRCAKVGQRTFRGAPRVDSSRPQLTPRLLSGTFSA